MIPFTRQKHGFSFLIKIIGVEILPTNQKFSLDYVLANNVTPIPDFKFKLIDNIIA